MREVAWDFSSGLVLLPHEIRQWDFEQTTSPIPLPVSLGPLDLQPAGQVSWDLFSWGCQLPRPRNAGRGRVGENWARTLISQGGRGPAKCVFLPWVARGLPWGLVSCLTESYDFLWSPLGCHPAQQRCPSGEGGMGPTSHQQDPVEEEYTPESSTGVTSPHASCLLGNFVAPPGT